MTRDEWTATVVAELQAGGFAAKTSDAAGGWPLVPTPTGVAEKKRLLEFKFSVNVELHLYAEGAVCLPARGSR